MKRSLLSACLLIALFFPSCVELDGQRLSFFYDAARDEMRVLLFYDGIHDKPDGTKGAEQIPEFVKSGSVMLLDWWGQLDLAAIRAGVAATQPAEGQPAQTLGQRAVMKAIIDSIRTEPIAHYRDA